MPCGGMPRPRLTGLTGRSAIEVRVHAGSKAASVADRVRLSELCNPSRALNEAMPRFALGRQPKNTVGLTFKSLKLNLNDKSSNTDSFQRRASKWFFATKECGYIVPECRNSAGFGCLSPGEVRLVSPSIWARSGYFDPRTLSPK